MGIQRPRIGLLGGSFNPIHVAHLYMAEVVRQECALDEVWFVPAQWPPHKQDQHIADGRDRIEMVRLATHLIPYFRLSLIEFERDGPSYTVDTMQALLRKFPGYDFSFIIGADMLEDLPNWHRIGDLVQIVSFIGVDRPAGESGSEHEYNLNHKYSDRVHRVHMLPLPISSSLIRKNKKEGKSIRFLVPDPVYHFIEEKRLYE